MNEKVYGTMKSAGVWSIVLGSVLATVSVAVSVLTIINGARLLISKKHITF